MPNFDLQCISYNMSPNIKHFNGSKSINSKFTYFTSTARREGSGGLRLGLDTESNNKVRIRLSIFWIGFGCNRIRTQISFWIRIRWSPFRTVRKVRTRPSNPSWTPLFCTHSKSVCLVIHWSTIFKNRPYITLYFIKSIKLC